jgi:hypothetical protein
MPFVRADCLGCQLRVVAIDDEISAELVKHDFNGIFVVEPPRGLM